MWGRDFRKGRLSQQKLGINGEKDLLNVNNVNKQLICDWTKRRDNRLSEELSPLDITTPDKNVTRYGFSLGRFCMTFKLFTKQKTQ